ncbi:MAG: PAS domain S-box protein, partial [Oscillochloris sp.]|nr:PAS domain S-box protein [Oscillochloris sp.]
GKPVFYAQTDKAFLDRLVSDPTQQQLLQSLGMQSAMVLPLIARGNPLGTISLVDADSQRAFGPLDLAIAERLAERVAIAIDNAQLYQELWQFRTTLDRTLDCVFMFNPESLRFLYVNQGAINQLGYSHEELLRMTPRDLQQTETLDSFRELITPLLNGTQSSITFETMYRHKLGYELPVEVLLQFVAPDNGPGRFVSIVRDITERRRAMTILENRNRELNQFAYLISHDLKAPLRGIANLAQWIDEDLGEAITPEVRGHLNLLHGRVARMERLINGLLDYSRIGRSAGTKSLVDVNVLIREVIDLLDPPAHVQITIAPHMPTLKTDQLLLQQVFANLISNSFKHHPGPAVHIQIGVETLGSSYRFRITDNGPGIDPIYHDRIFGLFQTLVPKDQFESSGIGLAIVKKIVEQYGGTVQIESQLGAGATFNFTWPA